MLVHLRAQQFDLGQQRARRFAPEPPRGGARPLSRPERARRLRWPRCAAGRSPPPASRAPRRVRPACLRAPRCAIGAAPRSLRARPRAPRARRPAAPGSSQGRRCAARRTARRHVSQRRDLLLERGHALARGSGFGACRRNGVVAGRRRDAAFGLALVERLLKHRDLRLRMRELLVERGDLPAACVRPRLRDLGRRPYPLELGRRGRRAAPRVPPAPGSANRRRLGSAPPACPRRRLLRGPGPRPGRDRRPPRRGRRRRRRARPAPRRARLAGTRCPTRLPSAAHARSAGVAPARRCASRRDSARRSASTNREGSPC